MLRGNMRPNGIDLFAGAGGLTLGFEQSGFDVGAAAEIDPIHAAVHKFNFPNCAVIPKSIVELKGKEIRKTAGIGRRRVDSIANQASNEKRPRRSPDRAASLKKFLKISCEIPGGIFLAPRSPRPRRSPSIAGQGSR